MKKQLFIDFDDILTYTTISGNIDVYKVEPHIYNAQILYIEPILGSDLYTKIETLISTGEITGTSYANYNTLILDYITPSIAFHTMELFVPFNSFQIADGGMLMHSPTNSTASPFEDIDKIVNKYKIIGAKYDDKLVAYLCKNNSLFTEYNTNTGLVDKTETTNRGCSWYLGTNNITSKIRI